MKFKSPDNPSTLTERHPILTNLLIILLVGSLGICIVYFSIALFTKHGKTDVVPGVENMTYTQAINTLHEHGFQVDIRDSLYKDDIKPGYVIEQFPKANSVVKPGRKIFLYINAVHPKEVVIDDDNHPMDDALRSFSFRSGMAKLQELGFKNVKVQYVLGDNDCIVKILANGVPVKKMQKVPVNAAIIVQVYDGRLAALRDSLQNEELIEMQMERNSYPEDNYSDPYSQQASPEPAYPSSQATPATTEEEEELEYF